MLQGTACTYVNLDFKAGCGKKETVGQQEGEFRGLESLRGFSAAEIMYLGKRSIQPGHFKC